MEFQASKLLGDLMNDMTQITCHINDLLSMGYDQRFELVGNKLMGMDSGDIFYARDLAVDYLYHLPDIGYVYGIRHRDSNVKGIFVFYSTNTLTLT